MTSIKELKGTKDFLAMDRKSCAMEAYQDCIDRNLRQKCQCNLWEVALNQVNPFLQCIKKLFLFLNLKTTSRKGKCAAQQGETVLTLSLTIVLIARCLVLASTLMLGSRTSTLGWKMCRSSWRIWWRRMISTRRGLSRTLFSTHQPTQLALVSKLLKENFSQIKFSAAEEPSSTLQLVQIYFDTASYDQVFMMNMMMPWWLWWCQ